MLETDPERFLTIVRNDDSEFRANNLLTAVDAVASVILRYGISNDPTTFPRVREVYEEFIRPVPADARYELYERVEGCVSRLGGETVGAFLPFILFDPDTDIVAGATIEYASFGSLMDGDPMSRPKQILSWLDGDLAVNRGAVLGGLLELGDPRICDLVAPLRSTIGPAESRIITQCYPGKTAKCVVEFYLDWADELVEREDKDGLELYGDVVAGLCRLGGLHDSVRAYDGLRPFPTQIGEEWPASRLIEYEALAASIADRLHAVEKRERPPRIITAAIGAFGLEPSLP